MNNKNNTTRLLGAAFPIQAIASAVGGFFLLQPLLVPGNIIETMNMISNNVFQMRASILVEMITAMGIVMLGVLLYLTLKKQNQKIAMVAMGLYLMEAVILAASRMQLFSLMLVSQESVAAGHPAYMQTLASLYMKTQNFGYELHMLPFALGATMFYFLFFKSRSLPMVLAILGIIAGPLALIGTAISLLGFTVPLFVFLPNLPFELAAGLVLLIKGLKPSPLNSKE